MRYGIISDVHSNLHALEACFDEMLDQVDLVVCLGDLTGYNAFPNACIDLVRSTDKVKHVILGNHDNWVVNYETISPWGVHPHAITGVEHAIDDVTDDNKKWLGELKDRDLIKAPEFEFLISHGSLSDTNDGYIIGRYDSWHELKGLENRGIAKILFFGHTHYPTVGEGFYEKKELDKMISDNIYDVSNIYKKQKMAYIQGSLEFMDRTVYLDDEHYFIIDPGSVGQPRDDGYTSYAILDTEDYEVQFKTLKYDYEAAMKAVEEKVGSEAIAARLKGWYNYDSKKDNK